MSEFSKDMKINKFLGVGVVKEVVQLDLVNKKSSSNQFNIKRMKRKKIQNWKEGEGDRFCLQILEIVDGGIENNWDYQSFARINQNKPVWINCIRYFELFCTK